MKVRISKFVKTCKTVDIVIALNVIYKYWSSWIKDHNWNPHLTLYHWALSSLKGLVRCCNRQFFLFCQLRWAGGWWSGCHRDDLEILKHYSLSVTLSASALLTNFAPTICNLFLWDYSVDFWKQKTNQTDILELPISTTRLSRIITKEGCCFHADRS